MRSGGLLRLCHTNDCNPLPPAPCGFDPPVSPLIAYVTHRNHVSRARRRRTRAGLRTLGRTNVRPVEAERGDDPGMRNPPRWRTAARPALAGLAPAGLALMAVAMLPPVEMLARRYLVVESVQFCLLSMAGPALIVFGAPWCLLRLSRGQAGEPGGRPDQAGTHRGLADRLAARPAGPAVVRQGHGLRRLVGWRLRLLAAAAGARCPGPSSRPDSRRMGHAVVCGDRPLARIGEFTPVDAAGSRPLRAAIAALALWSTWAIAFVLGFASGPVVHAYDSARSSLSAVADQELRRSCSGWRPPAVSCRSSSSRCSPG